jgi:hypothetical protein
MTISVTVTDEYGNTPLRLTIPDLKPEDVISPGMVTPGVENVVEVICKALNIPIELLK